MLFIDRNTFACKIGNQLDLRTSHYNGNQKVRFVGRFLLDGSDIATRSCQIRNRHSLRYPGRSRHLLQYGSALRIRNETYSGLPYRTQIGGSDAAFRLDLRPQ